MRLPTFQLRCFLSDPLKNERFTRTAHAAGMALALALTLGIYRGAFAGFFAQDDFGWLGDSRFSSFGEYIRCFLRFNPALGYRPLSQETFFWLGQKLFGMWPPGFHLFSVTVHLLGTALLYLLLRKFFDPLASLAGAVFYGTHAAHVRSVYWISAFPEPSAVACYLGAILLFVRFDRSGSRRSLCASVAVMILGVMCKESILTLPLVLASYCLLFSRRRLIGTVPFFLISGTYAFFRMTSSAVRAAPYPLTFGWEAWQNLISYFSWTAGMTETLLKSKFKLQAESCYVWTALAFGCIVAVLVALSRHRRIAVFSIAWFLIALQPVLYFHEHIDPYYLAPALAAVSLLLASAFPPMNSLRDWKPALIAVAAMGLVMWISWGSVRREGWWWTQRSFLAREILSQMPAVSARVPQGRIAYIFGFGREEFGVMQDDSAIKTYGFSPGRFILIGLDRDTPRQIRTLEQNGGLVEYYCFVYARRQFFDMTGEFHKNPAHFLFPVGLEVDPREIRRSRDHLRFRALNFQIPAMDLRYTLNGKPMPDILDWRLKEDYSVDLFVDESTRPGLYKFLAIRDSRSRGEGSWYPVDLSVLVR